MRDQIRRLLARREAGRRLPAILITGETGSGKGLVAPESVQARLLKVLKEPAVRRLGAATAEPVDAWIIIATNGDLQASVRQRACRGDLYHRLAVLTLRFPPLRGSGIVFNPVVKS